MEVTKQGGSGQGQSQGRARRRTRQRRAAGAQVLTHSLQPRRVPPLHRQLEQVRSQRHQGQGGGEEAHDRHRTHRVVTVPQHRAPTAPHVPVRVVGCGGGGVRGRRTTACGSEEHSLHMHNERAWCRAPRACTFSHFVCAWSTPCSWERVQAGPAHTRWHRSRREVAGPTSPRIVVTPHPHPPKAARARPGERGGGASQRRRRGSAPWALGWWRRSRRVTCLVLRGGGGQCACALPWRDHRIAKGGPPRAQH